MVNHILSIIFKSGTSSIPKIISDGFNLYHFKYSHTLLGILDSRVDPLP